MTVANTFSWDTGNGDWSVGANWMDLTSATAGPPTSSDDAWFFGNGGTITGSGNAFDASFGGDNPWVLAGIATISDGLFIANGTNNQSIQDAEVTIASGGTVTLAGTYSAVGNLAGSYGELAIDSGGTLTSTTPASSTTYLLNVGDQGPSSTLAGATGLVVVNGGLLNLAANSSTLNGLTLGISGGDGTLEVENAGTVDLGTANSNNLSALSAGKIGDGTVIVTGSLSALNAQGVAYFGRSGSGTLEVENGATAQFGTDPTGLSGLYIGRGSTSSGQPIGGSGKAVVNSGATLDSVGSLYVGGVGVSGELDVSSGTADAARLLVGAAAMLSGTTEVGTGIVNIGPGGVVDITGKWNYGGRHRRCLHWHVCRNHDGRRRHRYSQRQRGGCTAQRGHELHQRGCLGDWRANGQPGRHGRVRHDAECKFRGHGRW